jgi:hypothetical protein
MAEAGSRFGPTLVQTLPPNWAYAVALGATMMRPPPPSLAADLQAAVAAAAAAVASAMRALAKPGCDPSRSLACGYCAQASALTPTTSGGVLIAVGGGARSAVAQLAATLAALPSLTDAINNFLALTLAEFKETVHPILYGGLGPYYYNMPGALWALVPAFQAATDAVHADISGLAAAGAALTAQAAEVVRTGEGLHNYLLS